ncbi:hypothetical protein [uncultured Mediterranean phage]|nr:hypothetical protein [uncultured Mediterranean phage]
MRGQTLRQLSYQKVLRQPGLILTYYGGSKVGVIIFQVLQLEQREIQYQQLNLQLHSLWLVAELLQDYRDYRHCSLLLP